jgi:hypothetical protein
LIAATKIVSDPAMSRAMPPNSRRIQRQTSATLRLTAILRRRAHHLQVATGAETRIAAGE